MRHAIHAIAAVLVLAMFGIAAQGQDMPHEEVAFDCETCHTMENFTEVSFNHNTTGFVLEDRHRNLDCISCHTLKDFARVETSCISCHVDVHEARLGPDCTRCHSPRGWEVLDAQGIHMETNFPLSGRHALVDCQSCHRGLPRGDLSFGSTRCVECHRQDYLEVPSPNHVSAGFNTDCETCHEMNSWKPARLPDHDIFFPIFSGNHQGEWDECSTCHTSPDNFADFTCLVCHEHEQGEMDGTHAGIPGYQYNSQDCYFCHPRGEAEGFADHDAQFFPIFSGRHSGEWDDCSQCHEVPLDRKIFNCLTCHEHEETAMSDVHGTMTGYSYTSTACYDCHPTGEAGDFVAHDGQFFPIFTGDHAGTWDACATCHTVPGDRTVYDCLPCHEHRQDAMDGVHGSMTGYSYSSTACYDCHPTGDKGQFTAHDGQFFPIFSGRHQGEWDNCGVCHTVALDRSVFSCLECHEHNQASMDDQHLGEVSGYVYESAACYDCHPNGTAEDGGGD